MATNYDINYNDQRFTRVESDKKVALNDLESTYAGMMNASDKYYQDQIDASKQWADKQSQIQQEKTDFAIDKIEYEKELAKKDYLKEQSGAYVDWQKQSNQYGANAEQMAAQGLAGSGYSESSQVSMYNTYQNRVATARESYNQAIVNYNNAITEARLQNNSLLAEIAYNALQQQLELSLQGFQYKNQLILDKTKQKMEVENMYYNRYQDVLTQINREIALAEEVRQYNESKALEEAKLAEQKRQFDASLAEEQRQFNAQQAAKAASSKSSGSSGGGSSSGGTVKKTSGGSGGGKVEGGSGGSGGATIDMNSVLALGYGPISEAKLKQLVDSGAVEQYRVGNKIKFRKKTTKTTTSAPKGNTSTGSLTFGGRATTGTKLAKSNGKFSSF